MTRRQDTERGLAPSSASAPDAKTDPAPPPRVRTGGGEESTTDPGRPPQAALDQALLAFRRRPRVEVAEDVWDSSGLEAARGHHPPQPPPRAHALDLAVRPNVIAKVDTEPMVRAAAGAFGAPPSPVVERARRSDPVTSPPAIAPGRRSSVIVIGVALLVVLAGIAAFAAWLRTSSPGPMPGPDAAAVPVVATPTPVVTTRPIETTLRVPDPPAPVPSIGPGPTKSVTPSPRPPSPPVTTAPALRPTSSTRPPESVPHCFSQRDFARSMKTARVVAVVLSLSFATRVVMAQDDPRKAEAAPFFEEGRKLAEKNKSAEALEKFRAAYRIWPSPNTLFNIARQEDLLGQRLDALRDYREALKNPLLLTSAVDLARKHVAELERATARIRVTGPDGTKVMIGTTERILPAADAIDVDPGSVRVTATRGSESFDTTKTVVAGESATVEIRFETKSNGSVAETKPGIVVPPPAHEAEHGLSSRQVAGLVVGGAGIVGIGVGVGFLFATNAASRDYDSATAATGGSGNTVCTTQTSTACSEREDASRRKARDANFRDGFLFGGVGFVAVGAALFFWPAARTSSAANVRPMLGPVSGALFITALFEKRKPCAATCSSQLPSSLASSRSGARVMSRRVRTKETARSVRVKPMAAAMVRSRLRRAAT